MQSAHSSRNSRAKASALQSVIVGTSTYNECTCSFFFSVKKALSEADNIDLHILLASHSMNMTGE